MTAGLKVGGDPVFAAAGMADTTTSSTPRPSRPTTMTDKSAASTDSAHAKKVSVMQVVIARLESAKWVPIRLRLRREARHIGSRKCMGAPLTVLLGFGTRIPTLVPRSIVSVIAASTTRRNGPHHNPGQSLPFSKGDGSSILFASHVVEKSWRVKCVGAHKSAESRLSRPKKSLPSVPSMSRPSGYLRITKSVLTILWSDTADQRLCHAVMGASIRATAAGPKFMPPTAMYCARNGQDPSCASP